MVNEEGLKKLGLKRNDLDEDVDSETALVEAISGSGRLFRKVLGYLILRDLKTYFNNPNLGSSERIDKYFPYWDRKIEWSRFMDSMELKVPKLRTTNLAKVSIISYLIFYGYFVWHLLSKYMDFLIHMSLSGLALDGLLLMGALLPIIIIFAMGQRRLPANKIEDLVDRIIEENLFDLLTSEKRELKSILQFELSGDYVASNTIRKNSSNQ